MRVDLVPGQRRIVCVGNPFVAADDLGPRVHAELSRRDLPVGTVTIDGGLKGLDLLRFIEGAGRVVFVDSVEGFGRPGEVVTLDEPLPLETLGESYNHQAGFSYVLQVFAAICDGELPPVSVVGFEGIASDATVSRVADQALAVVGRDPCSNQQARRSAPARPEDTAARVAALQRENATLREEVRTARQAAKIAADLVVDQLQRITAAEELSVTPVPEEPGLEDEPWERRSPRGRIYREELATTREAARITSELVTRQFEENERVLRRSQELATQLEMRNEFIRNVFGRYVSDQVVASILSEPAGLELGGQRRPVTVLMSDLRGFTSLAERLAPEKVVAILNNFLAEMTEVINTHQGTINEFIGDAIFAIFGAPVLREDDAERAVACALDMQLTMGRVNRWNRERGLTEIAMGIGVNTGEVVVGNIGGATRMKYGTVGSPVNLTSRIEAATIGGQVLVSRSTLSQVDCDVVTAQVLEISPKGMKTPIQLHDVVGIGGSYNFHLRRQDEEWSVIDPPLACHFQVFAGKQAGDERQAAEIVALSERGVRLVTAFSLAPLANLKLIFPGVDGDEESEEAYAKVLSTDVGQPVVTLGFTSVDPGCKRRLDGLRNSVSGRNKG